MADGKMVTGADCELQNENGQYQLKTPGDALVRRAGGNLEVSCRHPDYPEARAIVISRANAGMYGNIILGGGIGALIDHGNGKAYSYPTWLQLTFGQVLSIDRANHTDGQPAIAHLTGVTTDKAEDTTGASLTQAPQSVNLVSNETTTSTQSTSVSKVTFDDLKDLMAPTR
ncbi:MAG: hypothetical protein H6943_10980 [Zoogloeaceae bacterium]|nr:hypothetical protein [Zoogloeaceae bacterium]